MLPIALDAMGGDHAPAAIVAGAHRARVELGLEVILVGRPEALGDTGDLEVVAASEVIAMDDDPGKSVRTKKDSSLVRCAELVRDGRAAAMVSAGNTGAAMASALFRMGRIKGVSRPAIATPIPVPGGSPTTLLDAGANSECQPEWLVQFAVLGSAYVRTCFQVEAPRVGLLSIGEEAGKGSTFVKEVHDLLAAEPSVNFVGNVEGRDVMTDAADVIVTDGFTGNVVLKTLEGAIRAFRSAIDGALTGPGDAEAWASVQPTLEPVWTTLDAEAVGGALLLGVDGVCVISHGSSSPSAIVSALATTRALVQADLVSALRRAVRPE